MASLYELEQRSTTTDVSRSLGYRFNHTMLRVKDPKTSVDFYRRAMGMELLRRLDFPSMQFSLYFLGILGPEDKAPSSDEDRTEWLFKQAALLELTHNWGTEDREGFAYHSGNEAPQGFGHICMAVPDLAAAERRFDELSVPFIKRAMEGRMKHVAFVKDPDGYWIEIVQPSLLRSLGKDAS